MPFIASEDAAFQVYRSEVSHAGERISFTSARSILSAYAAWQRLYDPESAEANIEAARKALARRLSSQ